MGDIMHPPGTFFQMRGGQVWCVYKVSEGNPANRVCVRTAEKWDTAIAHLERPITLHVSTLDRLARQYPLDRAINPAC